MTIFLVKPIQSRYSPRPKRKKRRCGSELVMSSMWSLVLGPGLERQCFEHCVCVAKRQQVAACCERRFPCVCVGKGLQLHAKDLGVDQRYVKKLIGPSRNQKVKNN